jgi:hypothetical protein
MKQIQILKNLPISLVKLKNDERNTLTFSACQGPTHLDLKDPERSVVYNENK